MKLYREAYRCLRPGGWLEHTDFVINLHSEDDSVPEDSIFSTWNKFFRDSGEKTGRTFSAPENGQNIEWMREAGFPGPKHSKNAKLPLGTWPADKRWKEVGAFNRASCEQGLEGYALYLGTKVLGWTFDEVQALLEKMRLALANRAYHCCFPW